MAMIRVDEKMAKVLQIGLSSLRIHILVAKNLEKAKDLAIAIATNRKIFNNDAPIYYVDGSEQWAFENVRAKPRLKIGPDGEIVAEYSGTIFPHDYPIVLLANKFEQFSDQDQSAYCGLFDKKAYNNPPLHSKSIFLPVVTQNEINSINPSILNRTIQHQI